MGKWSPHSTSRFHHNKSAAAVWKKSNREKRNEKDLGKSEFAKLDLEGNMYSQITSKEGKAIFFKFF